MEKAELRNRTKQFALRVIKLVGHLPNTPEAKTPGCRVLRSGTSIGADRCEAYHAKSHADFVSKTQIMRGGKPPEPTFWLGVIVESGLMPQSHAEALANEAEQLLPITVASAKNLRATH